MKSLLLLLSVFLIAAPSISQKKPEDLDLPELHKIKKITLSPSYSCRSVEDFQKGYAGTALFLTDRSRRINGPELLFNGACKSHDFFSVATAGDDVDAITDYGDVPLTAMAPSDLFGRRRPDSPAALFTEMADVKLGHSYGVLINKRHLRGFFFFRVMAHIPNQKVELEYVVMDYQEIQTEAESRSFDWSTKGYYDAAGAELMTSPSTLQRQQKSFDLPELHKIHTITLSPSYSCRSKEDFQKGYGGTALFLSKNSRGPELLFNGACGAQDYLQVTAGDDMGVLADLGKIELEDLTAHRAFNIQQVHSMELFSKFTSEAGIELGHTYAVLVNKSDERGLFFFTITGYTPNKRLDLRYAIKEFQIMSLTGWSPGFEWVKGSTN